MSAITAPEETRNRAEPASTEIASTAARLPSWRRAMSHTRKPINSAQRKCGIRAENSDTPKENKVAAVSQNESGGLPQKGKLSSAQGVIQSPRTTIFL